MVCYAVPATAAVVLYALRRGNGTLRHNAELYWLNLLLLGASIFGIVDHLWNGELFLISGNLTADLMLGAAITLTTFAAWGVIVALERAKSRQPAVAR